MGRRDQNQGFVCLACGLWVGPLTNGSYRNHCPACLHSVHLDRVPGDRAAGCGGLMRPVQLGQKGGRYRIEHECRRCGSRRWNRVAESTNQPDSMESLMALAAGTLCDPSIDHDA